MITTVTLNPCIDLTLYLPALLPGELNVTERSRADVCGKGINVSVVLRALGLATMCLGITFDGNGSQLDQYLEQNCIARDFAVAHGNIRTNIKIMDLSNNEMTEVNSRGEPVDAFVIDEYLKKLARYARTSGVLVFSGRVPNGEDGPCADIYRKSLEVVRNLPVVTVVDAENEPLLAALEAAPDIIKPNVHELEAAFGCKVHSYGDAVEACRDIIKRGVRVVCCSMGGDGAVIVDKEEAFYAPPLKIEARGPVGAGDSMVAGLCKGIHARLPLKDWLRCAVAAAGGSLAREGTQLCRRADFDRLLPLVKILRVK